ncbi:MAG TPA: glycosyltransferase family 1 protein [Candidatus Magasanikbacteria bacterium]|nr:glycosyltransferase family 1 protein [Candidatus Magasanikbacteria bacterium]
MKKIAIDARMYGKGFGLARYIESLVHGLQNSESEFSYVLYLKPEEVKNYRDNEGKFEVIEAPFHWYGWEEQTSFLSLLNKGTHDLVHFPHWNVPVGYHRPYVVTIHDLIMFHFPRYEATTRSRPVFLLKDKVHRLVVRHAARRAARVITTSEFTKKDIVETLHIPEEKISVAYQAPYNNTKSVQDWKFVESKLHIEKPYVLYVGAAYPHKNLERLVDAWRQASEHIPDHELILVGTKNMWYEKIEARIVDRNIPHVRLLGFVEDNELTELYRHARTVVFPSLYEGFGLPALEAMSMGTPVLASSTGSLPEVLGEAAYYVDPMSTDQIAHGLVDMIQNPDIQTELKIKGREQVQLFSSDVFIKKALSIYEKAFRNKR